MEREGFIDDASDTFTVSISYIGMESDYYCEQFRNQISINLLYRYGKMTTTIIIAFFALYQSLI